MKTLSLISLAFSLIVVTGCKHGDYVSVDRNRTVVRRDFIAYVDPREPWTDTGITLQEGKRYRFSSEAIQDERCRDYSDHGIPATPDGLVGFKGKLFVLVGRNGRFPAPGYFVDKGEVKGLRVLRDRYGSRASFLTVIGALGQDDSKCNVFVVGTESEIICWKTENLFVFCNDWPGGTGKFGNARFTNSVTYPNNTGAIRLTVETL